MDDIPIRSKEERLTDYAEKLSAIYYKANKIETRKPRGQFFTPKGISRFMATLFDIGENEVRLLDPGAGTGILSAAFCERLGEHGKKVKLRLDAYEFDDKLVCFLKRVLTSCKKELEMRGHHVEYQIHSEDFIVKNIAYFKKTETCGPEDPNQLFDFVICNPPYSKLNKDSAQSEAMSKLLSGQPNIYALFAALSASMLRPQGEMVFITPRSFCSGLYYRKFREWFLAAVQITNIHVFESRRAIFDRDQVLQENVIIKARKTSSPTDSGRVLISSSQNGTFAGMKRIDVELLDVVSHKNSDVFIRVPSSPIDVSVLHLVDSWHNNLGDFGLEISTGPVVPFRAKQYLLPSLAAAQNSAPLLWMHNLRSSEILWKLKKKNKPSAIVVSDDSMPLLRPVRNYVLVKRFSSKEQKRRLYAVVLLASECPYDEVGIENHLNYIHRPAGQLSVNETFGIAAILNTAIVDNYFRSLNGNTQVNATDIRSLPLPDRGTIDKIGALFYEKRSQQKEFDIDSVLSENLGVDAGLVKELRGVG